MDKLNILALLTFIFSVLVLWQYWKKSNTQYDDYIKDILTKIAVSAILIGIICQIFILILGCRVTETDIAC